ncbi:Antistasin family protein [Nannocystis exedens]|uniref:Antistasin family protein n=2 Tax=Nannocystis exedens TaxID=54 RepID=A0A1I2G9I4_9BACT|nr:Antistasin family protein [Nannocystis exedens]SFF14245.1 Antistasin family protein [Nannocystis exedens]
MPAMKEFKLAMTSKHDGWARAASCAALWLGLGCGQSGGTTEAGETGETAASTAATADTSSGSAATTTGSGGPTEGGNTGGETEGTTTSGGPQTTGETTTTSTTTTGETTTGETTTTSTTGETTAETTTTGETTSTTGETSTGGNVCDGFEQPGCIDKGCPEGQECNFEVDCVPSACICDEETQQITCTADCGGGTCVDAALCDPVACDLFCEFGFKKDEMGCEICACNEPPACGCQSDADCVKASPGCCSCNMGGTEVAVAAACVDQLEPCPLPPDQVLCPAVYLCTDAQAVCVQGQCALQ